MFFQLDTYNLLGAIISTNFLPNEYIVNIIVYTMALHLSQILCITFRFVVLCLFHEVFTRTYLLTGMLKKRLSLSIVEVYQEIRVVTKSLFVVQKYLVAVSLGALYLLVLLLICIFYVFIKQSNALFAIATIVLAVILMGILQVVFSFRCLLFQLSTSLLDK